MFWFFLKRVHTYIFINILFNILVEFANFIIVLLAEIKV